MTRRFVLAQAIFRQSLVLVALVALASGCAETPTEGYLEAVKAKELDDFDGFCDRLTQQSCEVVARMERVKRLSGGKLSYLSSPYHLLPGDEVIGADIRGNRAELKVVRGSTEQVVVMKKEEGLWRIDALQLGTFWAPLW